MKEFQYQPSEHESERASNSYLMSLIALMAGFPLPIINLFATFIFFLGNRKGTYFVRWHCTQALLAQMSLIAVNSTTFGWTMSIIFGPKTVTNVYIAWVITAITFNLIEFSATVFTAVNTRKGRHTEWFFYGTLTNLLCRK